VSQPTLHTAPRHIAIVMDGNGRWAKRQKRPRFWGHKRGVERVRSTVEYCLNNNIEALPYLHLVRKIGSALKMKSHF